MATFLHVIRDACTAVASRADGADEAAAFAKAIDEACAAEHLAPSDYARAVASDPELQRIEELAFLEAIGAPDPGPYGEISRESPSGKPGNTAKSRGGSAGARENR